MRHVFSLRKKAQFVPTPGITEIHEGIGNLTWFVGDHGELLSPFLSRPPNKACPGSGSKLILRCEMYAPGWSERVY